MELLALVVGCQPNPVADLEGLGHGKFAHYREVAVLDVDEQDELLDAALSRRWASLETKKRLRVLSF
jgi:hypothetical protein